MVNSSLLDGSVPRIFVSKTNAWYATVDGHGTVTASIEGNMNLTRIGSGGGSVFVTGSNNIYSYDDDNRQVSIWSVNATDGQPVMFISRYCRALFVDQNNSLYCSVIDMHQVLMKSLNDPMNTFITVAGTGCRGSDSDMLASPAGIFVDMNVNLYVADNDNHRIQLFVYGNRNGTTVAGDGASGTISLNYPRNIVLDGNGYLFIADTGNHRIVGSGPGGFRCVAGCTSESGSGSNQLSYPQSLNFDSDGNIWVADTENQAHSEVHLEKPLFRYVLSASEPMRLTSNNLR